MDVNKIKNEVKATEREFVVNIDGKERKYKIVKPSFAVGNRAELIYKKAFADALRAGLMTAFAMREELEKNEFYSSSSKDLQNIENEIARLEEDLKKAVDLIDAEPIILNLKRLRAQRFLEMYKLNAIYENTAESYAENIRNQFYASQLTLNENGSRVWKSWEDFQKAADTELAATATNEVMLFNAQIQNNFEMEYPENQWLLERNLIDENGNWIGEEKKEINVGNNVEELNKQDLENETEAKDAKKDSKKNQKKEVKRKNKSSKKNK